MTMPRAPRTRSFFVHRGLVWPRATVKSEMKNLIVAVVLFIVFRKIVANLFKHEERDFVLQRRPRGAAIVHSNP